MLNQSQIRILQDQANGKRLVRGKFYNSLYFKLVRARKLLGASSTPHAVAIALRLGLIK